MLIKTPYIIQGATLIKGVWKIWGYPKRASSRMVSYSLFCDDGYGYEHLEVIIVMSIVTGILNTSRHSSARLRRPDGESTNSDRR